MKKNNTKSLTRVFPEVIKTEGKHQSTKEIKR